MQQLDAKGAKHGREGVGRDHQLKKEQHGFTNVAQVGIWRTLRLHREHWTKFLATFVNPLLRTTNNGPQMHSLHFSKLTRRGLDMQASLSDKPVCDLLVLTCPCTLNLVQST